MRWMASAALSSRWASRMPAPGTAGTSRECTIRAALEYFRKLPIQSPKRLRTSSAAGSPRHRPGATSRVCTAMKGVEQPPEYHPEGDVWVHTLVLLEHLARPTPTLAMGALLHDVGKPPTF